MASLEDRITALEDKDEIRELTALYCHAVAAGDGPAISALFGDNASFKMGDRLVEGRAALDKFYGTLAENPPIPFIQNHVLDEYSSDQAQGRCSVEIRMVNKGESVTAAGWYNDKYIKINGQWKFAARDFKTFHMVPLSKGWA
ncbi:MAG: nuclear transport factor 2 family protein [Pseudomonadales bacterium]|nr:nuclear transport factor 2 family protein [Pseudomonadales bacterium]